MNTKRQQGRPTADGAQAVAIRVNISLTEDHYTRLRRLGQASGGASAWVRQQIDKATKDQK